MYCTSHGHKQRLKTNVKVYCVGHVFINNFIKMRNTSLKKNNSNYLLHSTIHYDLNIWSCLQKNSSFLKTDWIFITRYLLFTAVFWLFVSVVNVLKDVPLTIHHQRLPGHTYNRDTTKPKIQILNALVNIEAGDTIHRRLKMSSFISMRHTCDPKWPNGVLVECETLLQSMSSHVLIEDITSSEVQNTTVVLILGN